MSWFMHVSAVVGFAAFGGITAWLWTEARGQRQYVRVDATVLHSGVVESTRMGSSPGSRSVMHFEPKVRYRYEVAGQAYEGSTIGSMSWSTSNRAAAQRSIEPYPRGASVSAWVDPREPSRALLEPGVSPWLLGCFAAGAVLWLVIWETINWLGARKRAPSAPALGHS
jgi:hypothetical protein